MAYILITDPIGTDKYISDIEWYMRGEVTMDDMFPDITYCSQEDEAAEFPDGPNLVGLVQMLNSITDGEPYRLVTYERKITKV